ncbi:hypothetical protein GNY06_01965 [Elizabethkingia argentiflava]|uniref:Peptidase M50 n=1 Tax=Elizabethkingia argenteiflava TaxID=2681556 RepID=A0A845PPX2_9FLAO|nr:hypothetical protein [Elizabethkingia argenteiflava]NAW50202.1 hypothetical protein [Elizabethkingia argenteiflava]
MELNKNIQVFHKDKENMLLKVGKEPNLISISHIEYRILEYYSKVLNADKVIMYFQNEVNIDKQDLKKLIRIAESNRLIISSEENERDKRLFIHLILRRNRKIFEIFNVDFTNTIMERFFENKIFQKLLICLLAFMTAYFVYNLVITPLNFRENYLEMLYSVPVSFSSIVGFIYLSVTVSLFIHELGHYFVYKQVGGKGSVFGLGLMYFILPIIFHRAFINNLSNKKAIILTYSGGIILDFFTFLFLLYFTKNYYQIYPILAFLGYCLMTSLLIRSFFNLNFFLPGTDGYYIFTEIIERPDLHDTSKAAFKSLFRGNINVQILLHSVYFLLSGVFIIAALLFFILPLIIYFYYVTI